MDITPNMIEGYTGVRIELVCVSCGDPFSMMEVSYKKLPPTECHDCSVRRAMTCKPEEEAKYTKELEEEIKLARMLQTALSYIRVGKLYVKLAKYNQALIAFTKAIELDPNEWRAFMGKGDVLYFMRRFDDALDCYRLAVGCDPKQFNTLYRQAKTLKKLGRLFEASLTYTLAEKVASPSEAFLCAAEKPLSF